MRNRPAMKSGVFPEEKMKDAIHDVIENQRSTRSVAKDFGVNRCTLGRYMKGEMGSVDTEDRCYKKSCVTKQEPYVRRAYMCTYMCTYLRTHISLSIR